MITGAEEDIILGDWGSYVNASARVSSSSISTAV